ncbi:MAG: heme ABC exporter ATP-binding protein CcmA [Sphingobium sp.]
MIAQATNITCRRGGRTLFYGLSLAIDAGQSLVIRGPNGIGKSSLLRMMAGLLPCAEGSIDCIDEIAFSDERAALDPERSVRDALGFWAGLDSGRNRLNEAIGALQLSGLADVPVRMLSTGQRKRASLARTIASGAKLWLLDEPGNGLDTASLLALGSAIHAHVARGGGVIAASHFDLPHRFSLSLDLTDYRP